MISTTTGHYDCHGEYDSSTCAVTATGTRLINGVFFCNCNDECGGGLACDCNGVGNYAGCNYNSSTSTAGNTVTTTYDVDCGGGSHSVEWGSTSWTYTVEYTTEMLIDNTYAALPSYSGIFGGACEALRDLSDNEHDFQICRFRYKFTFPEPLDEDCIIHWVERTYDEDNNPIGDNALSETVSAGETESSVHEALEPEANGTVSVIQFPIGYCCFFGSCDTVTPEEDCVGAGGTFVGTCGEENPCDPNPCT